MNAGGGWLFAGGNSFTASQGSFDPTPWLTPHHGRAPLFAASLTATTLLCLACLSTGAATGAEMQAEHADKATADSIRPEPGAVDLNSWQGLWQTGRQLMHRQDYGAAEAMFKQALEKQPGEDRLKPKMLTDLGEALYQQGKYVDARTQLDKALQGQKRLAGVDSESVARCEDLLARIAADTGKLSKAGALAQRALSTRAKLLPREESAVAESYWLLAQIKAKQRLYHEAIALYERALEIQRHVETARPALADLIEDLAGAQMAVGRPEIASNLFTEALAIKTSTNAVCSPLVPTPRREAVRFRFLKGSPHCSADFSDKPDAYRITASGLTVQAAVEVRPSRFFDSIRVHILVTNTGARKVEIITAAPTLTIPTDKLTRLEPLDPEVLIQTVNRIGRARARELEWESENATIAIRTPSYVGIGRNITPVTTTRYVPDLAGRARAKKEMLEVISRYTAEAKDLRNSVLTRRAVAPGESVEGFVDFKRVAYRQATLSIPIGNAVFEFPLSPPAVPSKTRARRI